MSQGADNDRADAIEAFLESHQLADAKRTPLRQDASNRRYVRLNVGERNLILMDAPPQTEKPGAFVNTTRYLECLGARVPALIATDIGQGLLVIEDLGDQTFTRMLNEGADENNLYRDASAELVGIHRQYPVHARDIALAPYDFEATMTEASLFVDWYLPARLGAPLSRADHQEFRAIWQTLFAQRPATATVMVHRDYHVDNLLMVDGRCAMLDYQDALLGSPLYDLVSLLEDARRDVSQDLQDAILDQWRWDSPLNAQEFEREYRFWGAQRHCKVAGIFVRLWLRDGKDTYLHHLDRVMLLLARSLDAPSLEPLKRWISGKIGVIGHGKISKFQSASRTAPISTGQ